MVKTQNVISLNVAELVFKNNVWLYSLLQNGQFALRADGLGKVRFSSSEPSKYNPPCSITG